MSSQRPFPFRVGSRKGMTGEILDACAIAARERLPGCLVTVAAVTGSTPRGLGAKMLWLADGRAVGTIGGGKMEALAIEACAEVLAQGKPSLRKFVLHEGAEESFGAICGGEATLFFEPFGLRESIALIGAGHCAQAMAEAARRTGFQVTVVEDREEMMERFRALGAAVVAQSAPVWISARSWRKTDALVLVSRNHELDREALAAALEKPEIGYLGMIGSRRKVRMVFNELLARGVAQSALDRVYAPIGLDVGADSPAEIAISVLAEILQVLRGAKGGHLRHT